MKRTAIVIASIVLAGLASLRAADFVKIIHPNAASGGSTYVAAIDGDYVSGYYEAPDDGGYLMRGFLYQISTGTYQDLLPAGAAQSYGGGISGNTVVGTSLVGPSGQYEGFSYNISTGLYTTIANPYGSAGEFHISTLSGSLYYGFYLSSITDENTSFSTDGTSFAPLGYPDRSSVAVLGASGAATVGDIFLGPHSDPVLRVSGFFHDGAGTVILNFPGAFSTMANGTNGTLAVGSYNADGIHNTGYIYDGSTYTDYFAPGAANTSLTGITNDGRMIGTANATNASPSYGFLTAVPAPVPEPGPFALLGLGAAFGLARLAARRK